MDLSKQAYKAIKSNAELFSKVCTVLDVSPSTLPDKIRKRDPDFTRLGVINLIKEYSGLTDEEIIIDDKVTA